MCCCCAPQVIPKSLFCSFATREYGFDVAVFVVCRTKGFSAEHSQSSVLPLPACLLPTVHPDALFSQGKWHHVTWSPPWPKIESACISPGHLPLPHGPVMMLMSPSNRRDVGRSSIDEDLINLFTFGHKVLPNLCKSVAKALVQVLFGPHSSKMLIQLSVAALTVGHFVLLCQQKVTDMYSVGVGVSYSWLYWHQTRCRVHFSFWQLMKTLFLISYFHFPSVHPVWSQDRTEAKLARACLFVDLVICGRATGVTCWREGRLNRKGGGEGWNWWCVFKHWAERCSVGLCVQMSGPGLLIASLIKPFTVSLLLSRRLLWGVFKDFHEPFFLLSQCISLFFFSPCCLLTCYPTQPNPINPLQLCSYSLYF